MKKFLLLPLLLGLPSPLFADETDGYKISTYCGGGVVSAYLMKKENSNSKKWGVYSCSGPYTCSWADKAVSYDTAVDKYNEKCCKLDSTYCD